MDAFEDRKKNIEQKKISILLFLALIFARFMPFYEIKGIRKLKGWDIFFDFKIPIMFFSILFLTSLWRMNKNRAARLFVQIISLSVIMLCEFNYLLPNDYNLKHIQYGFWLSMFLNAILILYCIFVYAKNRNRTIK